MKRVVRKPLEMAVTYHVPESLLGVALIQSTGVGLGEGIALAFGLAGFYLLGRGREDRAGGEAGG